MRAGTALRMAAGVAGVALFGVAARYAVVRHVEIRPAVWVTWWVSAAVVHDMIVAPAAVAAGWLVVRNVPRFLKAPVQAGLVLSAVVVAVAGVWAVCAAWAIARLVRDRPAPGGATSLP